MLLLVQKNNGLDEKYGIKDSMRKVENLKETQYHVMMRKKKKEKEKSPVTNRD